IRLLYGPEFVGASGPLQILIWAQVVTAVDAVLQQAMLARGDVFPAIRHSGAGVLGQLALILVLTALFGLSGAALAALLSSALTLALDLRFVVRNIAPISIRRFAIAPIAVAVVVGSTMFVVEDLPFASRLLAAVGSWAFAMALFRVLPREELRFMMQLVKPRRGKQAGIS
ncbi:MAG: polysaccharide biosynthesis C-terminal domain-containing protein, partial [Woeseiaceae bacterium]